MDITGRNISDTRGKGEKNYSDQENVLNSQKLHVLWF